MEIALTTTLLDTDMSLVRRMAAGDEEALRALYAAYGRRLFAYAIRLTGCPAVAEEVLQDSLLAAWKGARGFRGQARAVTWLLGIVHHQALNATRRKHWPGVGLEEALDVADHRSTPDARAEAAERRQVLATAMDALSTDHRCVLELVFYQGLSLAEAAAVCRCPLGTVKSRLSYAKAHLRRALAQAGVREEDLP